MVSWRFSILWRVYAAAPVAATASFCSQCRKFDFISRRCAARLDRECACTRLYDDDDFALYLSSFHSAPSVQGVVSEFFRSPGLRAILAWLYRVCRSATTCRVSSQNTLLRQKVSISPFEAAFMDFFLGLRVFWIRSEFEDSTNF